MNFYQWAQTILANFGEVVGLRISVYRQSDRVRTLDVDNDGNMTLGPIANPAPILAGRGIVVTRSSIQTEIDLSSYGLGGISAAVRLRTIRGVWNSETPTQVNEGGFIGVGGWSSTLVAATRARIELKTAETWAAGAEGAYLGFVVTPIGSTVAAEQMRLGNDGRLGVGSSTSTLQARIHARAVTTSLPGIIVQTANSQNADALQVRNTNNSVLWRVDQDQVMKFSVVTLPSTLLLKNNEAGLWWDQANGYLAIIAKNSAGALKVGRVTMS